MKMTHEHLEHLRSTIQPLDTAELRAEYESGQFHNAAKVKDLNKRYRWDLLYMARLSPWICEHLYPYLTDDHIDTALRSLVPSVDRRF